MACTNYIGIEHQDVRTFSLFASYDLRILGAIRLAVFPPEASPRRKVHPMC